MSLISKLLLINKFSIPKEVSDIIKEYLFHHIKKLDYCDYRYDILSTIPYKEYDSSDNTIFVYLSINEEKDYFIVYKDFAIYVQTFKYSNVNNNNVVYFLDGYQVLL